MVFVLIFGLTLHWFPSQGGNYGSPTPPASPSSSSRTSLNHAILPAVALLITTIGTWILTMRNNMITTLAEDYVRMARAKGLPNRRIMFDYAARNAILPNLTGFAMSLGFVVSGAILIEYVFNYPGVGYMLLQAGPARTTRCMQALVPADHRGGAVGDPARGHPHRAARPADQGGAIAMAMPVSGVPTETPPPRRPSPPRARPDRPRRPAQPQGDGRHLLLWLFILLALFPGLFAQDSPTQDAYAAQHGDLDRPTCSAPTDSARTCSPSSSTAPGTC